MSLAAFTELLHGSQENVVKATPKIETTVLCNGDPVYGYKVRAEKINENGEMTEYWEQLSAYEITENFLDKFTDILLSGVKRQFSSANPDLKIYDKINVKTVGTKYGSAQSKCAMNRNRTEFSRTGFGKTDTWLRSRGKESKQVLLALHEVKTIKDIESVEGWINGKHVQILGSYGEVNADPSLNEILRGVAKGVTPKKISLGLAGDVSIRYYPDPKTLKIFHNLLFTKQGQIILDNELIATVEAVPSPMGKWENVKSNDFAQFLNKYAPRHSYGTFTFVNDRVKDKTGKTLPTANNPQKEAIDLYDQVCLAQYGQKLPMILDGDKAYIDGQLVCKFVTYGESVSLRWNFTTKGKTLPNQGRLKIACRSIYDQYARQIANKQSNEVSKKLTKLHKDYVKLGVILGTPDKFTTLKFERLIATHGLETSKQAIVNDLRDHRNGIVPSRTKGLF